MGAENLISALVKKMEHEVTDSESSSLNIPHVPAHK